MTKVGRIFFPSLVLSMETLDAPLKLVNKWVRGFHIKNGPTDIILAMLCLRKYLAHYIMMRGQNAKHVFVTFH